MRILPSPVLIWECLIMCLAGTYSSSESNISDSLSLSDHSESEGGSSLTGGGGKSWHFSVYWSRLVSLYIFLLFLSLFKPSAIVYTWSLKTDHSAHPNVDYLHFDNEWNKQYTVHAWSLKTSHSFHHSVDYLHYVNVWNKRYIFWKLLRIHCISKSVHNQHHVPDISLMTAVEFHNVKDEIQ